MNTLRCLRTTDFHPEQYGQRLYVAPFTSSMTRSPPVRSAAQFVPAVDLCIVRQDHRPVDIGSARQYKTLPVPIRSVTFTTERRRSNPHSATSHTVKAKGKAIFMKICNISPIAIGSSVSVCLCVCLLYSFAQIVP